MLFFELEDLVLLSRYSVQLIQPRVFRWGSRLRRLHLTGITFPALLQHLSSSRDLVGIQLHDISDHICFPPEALAKALSGMTPAPITFTPFPSPPAENYLSLPLPPKTRIALPALTCLEYRGTSKYLDSLVTRIDAPYLRDIGITFFSQPTIEASQLGKFIERIDMPTPLRRTEIKNLSPCHLYLLNRHKHFYTSSSTSIVQAVRLAVVLHGSNL